MRRVIWGSSVIGLATFVATACNTGVDPDGGAPGLGSFGSLSDGTADGGGMSSGIDGGGVTTGVDGGSGDADGSDTSADGGSDDGPPVPCAGVDCDPNATCENDICVCGPGYEGDGLTCTDIDGCDNEDCFGGVDCMDVPAPGEGYECGDCPPGYEGDGINCTDEDGCAGAPCFMGVPCTDLPPPMSGFECGLCPVGYEGDGQMCTDIDGCASSPCYMGVQCTDVPAPDFGFECADCPPDLFGDGINCSTGQLFSIGDQSSSGTLGPYFRGHGYDADADGAVVSFDVYLGRSAPCDVDFYIYEAAAQGSPLTQLWRTTVNAPVGTDYVSSGPANIPVVNGNYYVLGAGWNCAATYYWNNAGTYQNHDTGVGIFAVSHWDNSYPGPSDVYVPPNTGSGATAYDHQVLWAGP